MLFDPFLEQTASAALEPVILSVPPAETEIELHVPPARNRKCITIGKTGTYSPSLRSGILKHIKKIPKGFYLIEHLRYMYTASIELGIICVDTDKVALKTLAEPIAELRSHKECFALILSSLFRVHGL